MAKTILSSIRDQAFENIFDAEDCAKKRANRKGKRTQYIWQLSSGTYIVTDNEKVAVKKDVIIITANSN